MHINVQNIFTPDQSIIRTRCQRDYIDPLSLYVVQSPKMRLISLNLWQKYYYEDWHESVNNDRECDRHN